MLALAGFLLNERTRRETPEVNVDSWFSGEAMVEGRGQDKIWLCVILVETDTVSISKSLTAAAGLAPRRYCLPRISQL